MSFLTPTAAECDRTSDHFDGRRFHNQVRSVHRSITDFVKWMRNREPGQWETLTAVEPGQRPPERCASLRATFINHSTVLLQVNGVNILTDPIWSRRASPFSWIGPTRVRPPGIRFEDLPPIDVVLISHSHYDHMDIPTLKSLKAAHNPLFVVGLGSAAVLRRHGISNVQELDWWQQLAIGEDITLSGVPAQHFSQRTPWDRDKRLWLGYVLQSPSGAIYFAGDTGMGPHFEQIRQCFGPMTLSLLPIGAYKPRWFMAPMHLSPHEAVLVHQQLQSDYSIGIHFGTFELADDSRDEPVEELSRMRAKEGISAGRFQVLDFGEGLDIPQGKGGE